MPVCRPVRTARAAELEMENGLHEPGSGLSEGSPRVSTVQLSFDEEPVPGPDDTPRRISEGECLAEMQGEFTALARPGRR